MKAGANHPMGPFTLLDFVGLDTTASIADIMFDEYREKRFAAPPAMLLPEPRGMSAVPDSAAHFTSTTTSSASTGTATAAGIARAIPAASE